MEATHQAQVAKDNAKLAKIETDKLQKKHNAVKGELAQPVAESYTDMVKTLEAGRAPALPSTAVEGSSKGIGHIASAPMPPTIVVPIDKPSLNGSVGAPSFEERLRSVIATGDVLTQANLMVLIIETRRLVIKNANRITKFRPIADKLGSIETILIECLGVPENPNQEKLELTVDRGLDIPADPNTEPRKPTKAEKIAKSRKNRVVESL